MQQNSAFKQCLIVEWSQNKMKNCMDFVWIHLPPDCKFLFLFPSAATLIQLWSCILLYCAPVHISHIYFFGQNVASNHARSVSILPHLMWFQKRSESSMLKNGEANSPVSSLTQAKRKAQWIAPLWLDTISDSPAVSNIFAAFWHARCFIKLSQSSPPAIWQLRGTLFHSIHLSMVKTA